ncbi:hypothetical protein LTR04_005995 [Oleoguttula sp. CCFEE 6159]|nr:hypothetical protein LTR04_005995 [Oleoguttula sp. CCFEE 6159]
MAGRRLLDAAKLLAVSRSVAKQHIAIRSQQLDVYSKTSTLAKAVKNQTDRVTLTAKAAIVLAQRLNEAPPSSANFSTTQAQQRSHNESIPRQETVTGDGVREGVRESLEQDHHYDRSEENASAERPPEGELGVRQEKPERHPLPDGTIPPSNAPIDRLPSKADEDTFSRRPKPEPVKEPLVGQDTPAAESLQPIESDKSTIPIPSQRPTPSAEQTRRLQRQSEFQIPSLTAESQPASSSEPNAEKLSASHDRDVFYDRSANASSDYSSLPRTKIPKNAESTQGSDEHVTDSQMNQDVYYSREGHKQKDPIPKHKAIPVQDDMPEGINTDVFRSPRVSKLLSAKKQDGKKGKGLEMNKASKTPVDQTGLAQGKDQDTFNVRQSMSTLPAAPQQPVDKTNVAGGQPDEDVHELAADMAKEVESAPAFTNKIPTDVAEPSNQDHYHMRESRVPSSRFGRIWQFGGLATSMAFGAVGESFRRVAGGGGDGGSLMLSAGNMERLVAKLSRMRGAALKLGQMMSFQDSKMLPAPIQEVLLRVQDSADYMPASQRNKVLASNLGPDWRELFSSFDEVPMAAASIGQVHRATLASTGQEVAVKVQYPGVASSIDSDLSNISLLLTASRLLPKGLYLDKTIANARTELAWECDYIREAECARRFKDLLADEPDIFTVPAIIPEASSAQVLTAELMTGIGVTKLKNLTQDQRDWIGTHILRLCLRELCEFRFMQTDPNWTNFLYNAGAGKLELLDFGASREYPAAFTNAYIQILRAAAHDDRAAIRDLSVELGYLTGAESAAMTNAHLTSVLTLAEPFRDSSPEVYDFRDQTITERVKAQIPVMIKERLAPPPEETYSLHRKLSGAFLLCARLGARVRCREMFARAMAGWEERGLWEKW